MDYTKVLQDAYDRSFNIWKEIVSPKDFNKNLKKLKTLKLEVSRGRRTLGLYYSKSNRITISIHVLEAKNDALIMNIMLHEMLHCICGVNDGHKKGWKKYSLLFNKTSYSNDYDEIHRLIDTKDLLPERNYKCLDYKYLLICPDCGQEFKRKKLSKYIDLPSGTTNLIHKGCSSNLTVEEY